MITHLQAEWSEIEGVEPERLADAPVKMAESPHNLRKMIERRARAVLELAFGECMKKGEVPVIEKVNKLKQRVGANVNEINFDPENPEEYLGDLDVICEIEDAIQQIPGKPHRANKVTLREMLRNAA